MTGFVQHRLGAGLIVDGERRGLDDHAARQTGFGDRGGGRREGFRLGQTGNDGLCLACDVDGVGGDLDAGTRQRLPPRR